MILVIILIVLALLVHLVFSIVVGTIISELKYHGEDTSFYGFCTFVWPIALPLILGILGTQAIYNKTVSLCDKYKECKHADKQT